MFRMQAGAEVQAQAAAVCSGVIQSLQCSLEAGSPDFRGTYSSHVRIIDRP